ncbi:hypothetical protein [Roseiterribacter gracilis]|uniref:Uncharacterized protein n=1 Tax=Roseiterribacter gracilis TaxID=2812848 RepID=A0A8S8XBN0_9PROT|nr:hypothetical protein TMPK1_23610 [Rhodospirillales bacterium TMPK1]
MQIDIRTPLGLLFVCLGVILIFAGLTNESGAHQRLAGLDLNLCWGGVMLVFGALALALRSRSKA